jgi:hypothetical protein
MPSESGPAVRPAVATAEQSGMRTTANAGQIPHDSGVRLRRLDGKRLTRAIAVLIAALLLLALQALPALAAPPSNDTIGGATVVSLGFSQELDTTEATTDVNDAGLSSCGGATDASVWYSFTAAADGWVVVDVSQSTYSAAVLVGYGTPGSLSPVACGLGTAGFTAVAGVTYYILAVDDQLDGNFGNGGTLRISITAPPPPTVDVTLDPMGRVDLQTGVASLTGTYTCSNADVIHLFGEARQEVARFVVVGGFSFDADGTCDDSVHPWSVTVVPQSGKFAGGKAMTVTFAFSCSSSTLTCAEGHVERTVILRGGKL